MRDMAQGRWASPDVEEIPNGAVYGREQELLARVGMKWKTCFQV